MKFKYESLVFSFFALSTTTLFAAQDPNAPPVEPMGVTMQPNALVTPPVGPKVSNEVNFILTADFIYWRSSADNYAYAISGYSIVGTDGKTPIDPTSKGKVSYPDFSFQPGFKVGAGLKFAHDGWDLYANYTWLNPEKMSSYTTDSNGHMAGIRDSYFGDPSLSSASNSFKQTFNVVDLELGRNFFLSKYMTLRPSFGLKSAWINQNIHYYGTVFNNATNGLNDSNGWLTSGQINLLEQSIKLDSWGIGIRGGISPVWYFLKGFGLYGNLAVSGMWTCYKNHYETSYFGTISGTSANFDDSYHNVTPVIELGLGLTYMTTFCNDSYGFSLSGGWEEQMWIGFNDQFTSGNMVLQGLTIKAGFEF